MEGNVPLGEQFVAVEVKCEGETEDCYRSVQPDAQIVVKTERVMDVDRIKEEEDSDTDAVEFKLEEEIDLGCFVESEIRGRDVVYEDLEVTYQRHLQLPGGCPVGMNSSRISGVPDWFVFNLAWDRQRLHHFLRDAKLLASSLDCVVCGKSMTLSPRGVSDGYMWRCGKRTGGLQCHVIKTIREGSWFKTSRLSIGIILYVTYKILNGDNYERIMLDAQTSSRTIRDWTGFVKEALVDHLEANSERIGGEGVVVEINESRFGKRKYNRGTFIEGQWTLGGVDHASKRMFLVALRDRSPDTLVSVIRQWVLPGSVMYTSSWNASDRLTSVGRQELTVDHKLKFANFDKNVHMNYMKSSKGRTPRSSLAFHERLGEYMFEQVTKCGKFLRFLDIVRRIDWTTVTPCNPEHDDEPSEKNPNRTDDEEPQARPSHNQSHV